MMVRILVKDIVSDDDLMVFSGTDIDQILAKFMLCAGVQGPVKYFV